MFRGLALLIIFITHIPGLAFAGFTPRAFGFADAAEAFVLLAGLAAYFAYARTFLTSPLTISTIARGTMPIFTRVWQLYITHVALVILITGIVAAAARRFGDPEYLESGGLDILLSQPAEAVLGIVSLTFLPHFLDILPLYIVLLAAMPAMVVLFRVHALLPLSLSVALYVYAQITGFNLPNINASSVWFFNPFAWQLIFVLGLTVSHLGVRQQLAALFEQRILVGLVTVVAAAIVTFSFLAAAPWRQFAVLANVEVFDASLLPVADKTNLSPLRLADALAKFWLIAVFVSRTAGWLTGPIGQMFSLMGRHSLPIFVLGLVLSTVATILIKEASYAMWAQTAVTLAGAVLMLAFASLLDWQASSTRKELLKKDQPTARMLAMLEPALPPGPPVKLANVVAEPSTK